MKKKSKRIVLGLVLYCMLICIFYSCEKKETDQVETNQIEFNQNDLNEKDQNQKDTNEKDSNNYKVNGKNVNDKDTNEKNSKQENENRENINQSTSDTKDIELEVDSYDRDNAHINEDNLSEEQIAKKDKYLKLLIPFESMVKIEDGAEKSCDLILNVGGYLYCYSFDQSNQIKNFKFEDWVLIFDENDLTDYEYTNGIYAYMKVGIYNGEKSVWLGKIYTNTQGKTDDIRNMEFGYEDEAMDFSKTVPKAVGEEKAGYILDYDAEGNTVNIQFGDAVYYDTYTAIENISDVYELLDLSEDIEIVVWSLSTTGDVFIEKEAFQHLMDNDYFVSRPCKFIINDNKVTGIYEILNP